MDILSIYVKKNHPNQGEVRMVNVFQKRLTHQSHCQTHCNAPLVDG